jgi:cyclopropane fatty-acyl-phospholipid synthase-like methyltransferase
MRVRRVIVPLFVSMLFVAQRGPVTAQQAAQTPTLRAPDVIYVPTPHEVVEGMLKLAKVGPNDVVYDLGSGDGRIPIAAVQKFQAKKGIGIDINPERIKEAQANHSAAGVGDKVTFILGDLFEQDIKEATVVTLYLLPSLNSKLIPKFKAELKPGTRIVSQSFDMKPWEPDQQIEVDGRPVYLWIVK